MRGTVAKRLRKHAVRTQPTDFVRAFYKAMKTSWNFFSHKQKKELR